MIRRELRAKYQIEQYPVLFRFPEIISGDVSVKVTVLSGVDLFPDSLAGLPTVQGDSVAVLIVGGVPGVTYSISVTALLPSDTFTIEGVLTVLPTVAIAPPATPALPLTSVVTTPPYPVYEMDELAASASAIAGYVWVMPLDELDAFSFALNGVLRELILFYDMIPEELDVSSYALSGIHRMLMVFYDMQPDELDVASITLNGTHKLVVIEYLNYPPEALDASSLALNGTHGPI